MGGGVFNDFIFPCINWKPKGIGIRNIIRDTQLRNMDVLFIDDNKINLAEALFYNKDINIADPAIIPHLLEIPQLMGKPDLNHERLKQYKLLENRKKQRSGDESNLAFLYDSGINVNCHNDCWNQIDRILDMITRTNQLNFTKKRISKEELLQLVINQEFKTGYVTVNDRYGDYGIVGFYAITNSVVEHFLFSCRILGMGVEQYMYAFLGFPDIVTQGETTVSLNRDEMPAWINHKPNEAANAESMNNTIDVLVIGGCDVTAFMPYLNSKKINIAYELDDAKTFLSHTSLLVGTKRFSQNEKNEILKKFSILNPVVLNSSLYDGKYDFVVLSLLRDYGNHMYCIKDNPRLRFGFYRSDRIMDHDRFPSEEIAVSLNNAIEFDTILNDEFLDNLQFIRKNMSTNTKLILMNASEIKFISEDVHEKDRHIYHCRLNHVLDNFVSEYKNVFLIDIRKIIKSADDYTNRIRHYKRVIYFQIAQEILKIIDPIAEL
jgi:hypothetical protein